MEKPIELIYVRSCGDETALYNVRILKKGMTVRDLVNYVRDCRRGECGSIDIVEPGAAFGTYKGRLKYCRGLIKKSTLSEEDLDLVIGRISANGGYNVMSYTVREVER